MVRCQIGIAQAPILGFALTARWAQLAQLQILHTENGGRGDAGGLSRRLVDDNHPVHALLFHFCILLHTSSPSSAPLALHRWLDALLRRFRDEGEGKE